MAPPPRWLRRVLLLIWLPLEVVLLVLLAVVAVLGLVGVVVDRRVRVSRLAAMGVAYLALEMLALAALLGVWLSHPLLGRCRYERANLAVTAAVLRWVLGAARVTVGMRVEMQGPDGGGPFAHPDPVVVLARHGGIGDSFALVWLIADRLGRRPRVVLKDLLLWEPMIDVALGRLHACFLPSPAHRREPLEGRVAAMAETLEDGDALLLFPEGGNWTPRRRLVAIGRLWKARKPAAVRTAAMMEHVLPPRTGGVLACLEARPDLAVTVIAHAGLDKLTSAGDVWRSLPFERPMTVRWWPAAHPPYGEEERVEWLTAEWAVIDQWVGSHHDHAPAVPPEAPGGSPEAPGGSPEAPGR